MKKSLLAFALIASFGSFAQASFSVCADDRGGVFVDTNGTQDGFVRKQGDARIDYTSAIQQSEMVNALAGSPSDMRSLNAQFSEKLSIASQNLKSLLPLLDIDGNEMLPGIEAKGTVGEYIASATLDKADSKFNGLVGLVCSLQFPDSAKSQVEAVISRQR